MPNLFAETEVSTYDMICEYDMMRRRDDTNEAARGPAAMPPSPPQAQFTTGAAAKTEKWSVSYSYYCKTDVADSTCGYEPRMWRYECSSNLDPKMDVAHTR